MALKIRNSSGGVVSGSRGRGPVVSGGRRVRGRVIGEMLSGRKASGAFGQTLRPARAAKSGISPARNAAPKVDDYSDFGFDDGWKHLRGGRPMKRRRPPMFCRRSRWPWADWAHSFSCASQR